MLERYAYDGLVAGLDEAGRGCLAGPVVAAAVILPDEVDLPGLNDSKQLTHVQRMKLRVSIMEQAVAWNLGIIATARIDEINILNATFEAMHEAVAGLSVVPDLLLIDGNRFPPYASIPNECIVRGDCTYLSIAAASVLAKTFRDELMDILHRDTPQYSWLTNKGYPTRAHKNAIATHGPTSYHRKSFNWKLK